MESELSQRTAATEDLYGVVFCWIFCCPRDFGLCAEGTAEIADWPDYWAVPVLWERRTDVFNWQWKGLARRATRATAVVLGAAA
jgi:hypothetical protein